MNSSSQAPWESFKKLFAVDHEVIEQSVEEGPDLYKELDPRALYTSLEDLYSIMQSDFVSGTWVDLGGGLGESALMYSLLFPERKAIAIEKSRVRNKAAQSLKARLKLRDVEMREGDLLECEIPDAETYFLYFPTGPVLDRILDELRNKKSFKRIIAIESHGDFLARLKKENWLSLAGSISLTSPRHHPEALVFEKNESTLIPGPHQLSYQQKYLLIDGEWIGDSFGLEWLRGNHYQLLHPPRTIEWRDEIKLFNFDQLPKPIQLLVTLRRLGRVKISTTESVYIEYLRKIKLFPSFEVELSSGEWVRWNQILTISTDKILCYESSSDYFFSPLVPITL